MEYLVIDASLSGTGIRDYYKGGYIIPEHLGLSTEIVQRLKRWLSKYEYEHYNGFTNDQLIEELDKEGKEIALVVKNELSPIKMGYLSDARMTTELI